MRAECPCPGRAQPRRNHGALVGSSLGVALGVAAALLPKCPLCIAAYLSLVGVGTAAAHTVAPLLFPIGIALSAISLASLLVLASGRREIQKHRDREDRHDGCDHDDQGEPFGAG